MTEKEIEKLCMKYRIYNYIINDDMSVNVEDNVYLTNKSLDVIPLNFNKVEGSFYCRGNNLTSLKGSPNHVTEIFDCSKNKLRSLKYSPQYVGETYHCYNNFLTSLKDGPKYVGYNFYAYINNIKTLEYLPKVEGDIDLDYNIVEELWNLFKDKNHIEYFNELDIIQDNGNVVILDRLNYFLTDVRKKELNKELKNYTVK